MTLNYYLAWLHFDSRGRMTTRLPEGHRVLEVLHNSSSNRHPPSLWVLVEAVVSTPSYTPPAGFPSTAEMPAEYRQPSAPPPSMPIPVPSRTDFDYGQEGRTRYPELYPEARDDDYRSDTGSFIPSVPMSPASGTPTNGQR